MDLDVSYVRYPGLWHVSWEEGKCALGQSVVKLAPQLLDLMDKTASFKQHLENQTKFMNSRAHSYYSIVTFYDRKHSGQQWIHRTLWSIIKSQCVLTVVE